MTDPQSFAAEHLAAMSNGAAGERPGPAAGDAAAGGEAAGEGAAQRDVLERIRRYVVAAFRDGRAEGLTAATPLVTSGIIDSAGVLQVIDWLEATFAIRIEDEAVSADNFDSLDALARMVCARRTG